MALPGNGLFVVQGEMSILLTAMKRGNRWSSHSHQDDEIDSLIRLFVKLKEVLNQLGDLRLLDPSHYFEPFLEVIRSGETNAPITSLAVASVNKFISYNLIDPSIKNVAACVENIADAITHARFVGTDQASGVVLINILQVLRSLMLSPVGILLSNESTCEIMMTCFRICFEMKLNELLRRSAEHCLKDLVELLFARLPQFTEDQHVSLKKLKMGTGNSDHSGTRNSKRKALRNRQGKTNLRNDSEISKLTENWTISATSKATSPVTSPATAPDVTAKTVVGGSETQATVHPDSTKCLQSDTLEGRSLTDSTNNTNIETVDGDKMNPAFATDNKTEPAAEEEQMVNSCSQEFNVKASEIVVTNALDKEEETRTRDLTDNPTSKLENAVDRDSTNCANQSVYHVISGGEVQLNTEYINQQGVRFTTAEDECQNGPLLPYGVGCVRELLKFLVSLCNPNDKENTEKRIDVGLYLLTVALEVGADNIGQYNSLLILVKDDLCRNLFSLLGSDRITILAAALRFAFLLFEALRHHLKFQLERYLQQLADIVASDSPKITYEHKELAIESISQLWRIPGLVTELYLNYDCNLYCSNVFEDLAKLLSKNTFPVPGLYNIHLLSLDALITVIDSIERNCHKRMQSEHDESAVDPSPTSSDVTASKELKVLANISSRTGRSIVSSNIPTHEQLMAVKHKKKLLDTGTEQFNAKAKRGIKYLQEHHILSSPLDTTEVVHFLRENPRLDKKMIGEFISSRDNLAVLDSFVKSFDFTDMRIDEALRQYLEMFRLPGESPLISLLLEHFADHWHKCNGEPFANNDAAFTLAYAVIMLNVDQHNLNAKRQNNPMTCDDFKRNLKKVNGGKDFDEDMLDEIFKSIRESEIVMPAEQTGTVRENYLWKVLLRRGAGKDGQFINAPSGLFDHDLFSLIWGPSVAALSFIFDRSEEPHIYQKAIAGFLKCALISAHYGMSNDFDNLIISLCKFTTLAPSTEANDSLAISFGGNAKAQLVTRTVFGLAQRHGDILRHGWANVLDCLLQLYRCKLLPKVLTEAEDFIEPNGKISLMREEVPLQKTETSLLSSIYSYLSSEPINQRMISPEDQECIKQSKICVRECHLEQLITESKFLRLDSLQEMVKALILASHGPDGHPSLGTPYSEDAAIFFLELLIKVIIPNKDRVSTVWASVRDHIYSLLVGAAACEHHFLMERCIVGLLRLAISLMRREEMSPVVLQSLRMLLLLKWAPLSRVSRNVAFGLHELLKASAANIHTEADWSVIFTLLEVVGAGAPPPRILGESSLTVNASSDHGAKSDGELHQGSQEDSGISVDRGYTSDSELSRSTASLPAPSQTSQPTSQTTSPELSPSNITNGGWILVGREGEIQPLPLRALRSPLSSTLGTPWDRELLPHDPLAFIKCCESLTFLVRDVAHITPYNFEHCVHCVRTFVEASLQSTDKSSTRKTGSHQKEQATKSRRKFPSVRRRDDQANASVNTAQRRARSPQNNPYDADESDSEELSSEHPLQLLDLMHTLHTRTAQIYRWWGEESPDVEQPSLWAAGWCPLLQGIARLCCDCRKEVRMSAIRYLQSALLMHDLQTLSAQEWESCFRQVLFPLLDRLLEPVCPGDPARSSREEETRMRAVTSLSKVFLHHLTPLLSLPNFNALWLTILDFMDKYMHAERSDDLLEAIPETLKNMLLVMDSAGVFSSSDGYSPLWNITWEKIDSFLPSLRAEFSKAHPSESQIKEVKEDIATSSEYEVLPNQQEAALLQQHHQCANNQLQQQNPQDHLQPIQHQQIPLQQQKESLPNQLQMQLHSVGFSPIQAVAPIPPTSVGLPHHPIPISAASLSFPFADASQQSPPTESSPVPSSSNIILQPPCSFPSVFPRAPSTTIFPHMGQLVSTPITGPSTYCNYVQQPEFAQGPPILPPSALPAVACQAVSISHDEMLEAFTPTRSSHYPNIYPIPPERGDGGVIPVSCYFYQEQPVQSSQTQSETVSSPTLHSGTSGGSKGILLDGANIPNLPILSPFAKPESSPAEE